MVDSATFSIMSNPPYWKGGEPRVFAVSEEERELNWPVVSKTRLVDVRYQGGGLTALFDTMASACQLEPYHSFQALLENLEALSENEPLVVWVRDVHLLLRDVGPAVLHFASGWEMYTHQPDGVSAMYLVLETGPRAITNAAFHPGGIVDWA